MTTAFRIFPGYATISLANGNRHPKSMVGTSGFNSTGQGADRGQSQIPVQKNVCRFSLGHSQSTHSLWRAKPRVHEVSQAPGSELHAFSPFRAFALGFHRAVGGDVHLTDRN